MWHKPFYISLFTGLLVLTAGCRQSEDPPEKISFPVGVTRDLLDADLGNCRVPDGGWAYKDGILTWLAGKGDVWTKHTYGDFTLDLEWKITAETNSGIIFRCADPNDWMHTGLEVQIHAGSDGTKHGQVSAIYDLKSPTFYQNARLLVQHKDNESQASAPVPGLKHSLGHETSITVKKVFTNLKLMERNGKQLPYNASGEEAANPALLCEWTHTAETTSLLIYPDGTRDAMAPPDYQIRYEPGHWLAKLDVRKSVGEWNHFRLTALGPVVQVDLNGTRVIDINLDEYTEAGRNPQGTRNKYPVAVRDLARRGYIALQDHGKPVWFRNVTITPQ